MVCLNEGIDHDSSLFWPSDCILVRFPLLIFIFSPFDQDISPKASIVKSQDFLSYFLLCFVFLPAFSGLLSLSARKDLSWAPCPTSEGKNAD